MSEQMRCERCKRFIGDDCLEGWSGGLLGDYSGSYYCAYGVGCNSDEALERDGVPEHVYVRPANHGCGT